MSEPNRRQAFGARLRRRRKDLKLTQHKLAAKIGATPESICHWEKGHYYPRRYFIFRLAKALDCDRSWLEGIPGATAPIFHDGQENVSP